MKRGTSLLLALYTAFLSFTLQTYIWGEKGLIAYSRLEEYKEQLLDNDKKLEEIYSTLDGKFDKYTENREAIEAAARSLGYYEDDVRRIYIEGYEYDRPFYLVGRSVGDYSDIKVDVTVFRIVSLLIGLVSYVIARSRRRKATRTREL